MEQETKNWQAVFFDFDGVIAHSGPVKVQAFAHLFAPYGAQIEQAVVAYQLANGGMPRQEKLRHCLEHLAGQSCTEKQLSLLGQRFSQLVLDEVVAAPLVAGALATLRHLSQAGIPCYVVSGTPQEEIALVVARKNLAPFFAEVHGSPQPKGVIILDILHRCHYTPAGCLFIGDALADYRAAQETGLAFLGIVEAGAASMFAEGVAVSPVVCLSRWTAPE